MFAKLRPLFVDGLTLWHRLWSVRFAILATLCGILGQVLAALPGRGFMLAGVVFSLLAALASLVKQPGLLADIEARKNV